jgi:hypothetical protein
MGYYISRCRPAADNCLYVEIAAGGKTKACEDILPLKYEGEQKNLVSPIDAVNVAVKIYKKWQIDYHDEQKKLKIIDKHFTSGEKIVDFDKRGIDTATAWANVIAKTMDKCHNCKRLLGSTGNVLEHDDIPNSVFCSQNCLATTYKDRFGNEPATSGIRSKK